MAKKPSTNPRFCLRMKFSLLYMKEPSFRTVKHATEKANTQIAEKPQFVKDKPKLIRRKIFGKRRKLIQRERKQMIQFFKRLADARRGCKIESYSMR